MSHGVKYFDWRDGRPRWTPGPGTRAKGFKARDLKDGAGDFLPLEPALALARQLNERAGVPVMIAPKLREAGTKRARGTGPAISGYVYFLWVGDSVKIGFSKNPFERGGDLMTGLAERPNLICAVRGTTDDERYIHRLLARHRRHGEWFHASEPVINLLMRAVSNKPLRHAKQEVNGAASHVGTWDG